MSRKGYFKVRIKKCSDPYFWYADKVGDYIYVRKHSWDNVAWGYEHTSGFSVFKGDVE